MALAPTLLQGCQNSWIRTRVHSWTGPVAIHHQVEVATPNCLRLYSVKELTVSRWYWGEGAIAWKECQYAVDLGQTLNLLRLRQF